MKVNKLQVKLVKSNPSLFKKEIKKLYHEGKLESLLTLIYSPKIINILEEEKIFLTINNLNRISLLSLLEYPLFVDYILNHHIECISFIPDKMLKKEHIVSYAKYLQTYQIDIASLNKKLFQYEEVVKVVLSKINSSKDLEFFLNNVNNEKFILEAITIGEERKLFNGFISENFYKSETIFKRMLKIYGNKILFNLPANIKMFIPAIANEIINNNLILNSNNNLLLKEPEIIKAILKSPNVFKMTDILNDFEIDINNLNESELISLTELIYYNFINDPFTFAFISNNLLKNSIILKEMLYLNHFNAINIFKKEAFNEENIKIFSDYLFKENSLINLVDYDNLKYFYSSYFMETLKKILNSNLEDFEKEKILKIYIDLAIKNKNEQYLIDGLNYLKEKDLQLFEPQTYSSFLLKILISLNDIELINQMNLLTFTDEHLNSLFKKFSFNDFIKLNHVSNNMFSVFKKINLNSEEDYLKIFENLYQINNDSLIIDLIRRYNDSKLNISKINEIRDYFLNKITNKLNLKFNDFNTVNTLLEDILNGKKNAINLEYLKDYKALYCATYIANIDSIGALENVLSLPLTAMEKANKKHIREIINLLENYHINEKIKILLAYNIYLSIGYARAKDLLNPNPNKNYGSVNNSNLSKIFLNIKVVDVMFKKEGNGYVPVLNEEWIKLIFGESYKVKNTPIRNYLNIFQDKEEEIDRLKAKVDDDLSLNITEKQEKKNNLDKQYNKYIDELKTFIDLCSSSFNDWDIILEEYFKSSNKSKLKTKLNIAKVNEILKLVSNKRNLPELELQDELLLNSDVFNYVGYDNQYTVNPENAPKRAVYISRKMNNYQKKFPNIMLQKDDLILLVYNPQDRRILSAGYRSKSCFRPNGMADNHGQDYSLLFYCATNEYGGGLEIKNLEGETIMFSPILRNGNVLMIHSIETKGLGSYSNLVHELLVEFGNKCIEECQKNNDDLSFVTITNLHNLDTSYTIGSMPSDKKFRICNGNPNMYHNLEWEQFLLARKDGKYFKDIKYNEDVKSYIYPEQKVYVNISLTKEELLKIIKLYNIYKESTVLANERYQALKNNDEKLAYELLYKVSEKKKEYLNLYQEILKWRHGRDLYQEYIEALNTIKRINEKLKISINENLININMGNDWYIAYDENNNRYAYALESGQEQLQEELRKINNLEDNKEVMKL